MSAGLVAWSKGRLKTCGVYQRRLETHQQTFSQYKALDLTIRGNINVLMYRVAEQGIIDISSLIKHSRKGNSLHETEIAAIEEAREI